MVQVDRLRVDVAAHIVAPKLELVAPLRYEDCRVQFSVHEHEGDIHAEVSDSQLVWVS
jgi:hypothetical protein